MTRNVAWTQSEATDAITAESQGPTCAQAVVTFVARSAEGDPLWAFASTYFEMTAGGPPPNASAEISAAQIDAFLAGWANVEISRSSDLPEWRGDAATLTESADTFSYDTPFDRETYEMLRARDLATLCFAAGVETVNCLVIDPASQTPALIVAYGP